MEEVPITALSANPNRKMYIKEIKLRNYRNHIKRNFEFSEDTTLIIGNNGTGKTNILEAIHLLSTAKSKRSRYDRDLINYEHKFCTIEGDILSEEDKLLLELQIIANPNYQNASSKKAKINKVTKSINSFTGLFNSVLFTPEDIDLLTGTPSNRRKYMDSILIQIDKNYKRALSKYTKTVRQRNKLLEQISETNRGWRQIEFWDQELLELGKLIQKRRITMFENLEPVLQEKGKLLNEDKTNLKLHYKKSELSRSRINEIKNREIAARNTLMGPHKEDFYVEYDGHNVGEFGSRGQQRSIVLGLKLAEIIFLETVSEKKPVLLLDDIFSEFDKEHQKAVLSAINGKQTIITSAEELNFLKNVNRIEL